MSMGELDRLKVVQALVDGLLKPGSAERKLGLTVRQVHRLVMRYCAEGPSGLVSRTQRLPKVQEDAFRQAVEQLQASRGGGRVRGEDIRQLLAEQFAVTYSLNGVYDLLKRLDMAWITARSVSPHADPVRQAEFQKNFSSR